MLYINNYIFTALYTTHTIYRYIYIYSTGNSTNITNSVVYIDKVNKNVENPNYSHITILPLLLYTVILYSNTSIILLFYHSGLSSMGTRPLLILYTVGDVTYYVYFTTQDCLLWAQDHY